MITRNLLLKAFGIYQRNHQTTIIRKNSLATLILKLNVQDDAKRAKAEQEPKKPAELKQQHCLIVGMRLWKCTGCRKMFHTQNRIIAELNELCDCSKHTFKSTKGTGLGFIQYVKSTPLKSKAKL